MSAGSPGQRLHEPLIQHGQADLAPVQVDELWVKVVGGSVWLVPVLAVQCRCRWAVGSAAGTRWRWCAFGFARWIQHVVERSQAGSPQCEMGSPWL